MQANVFEGATEDNANMCSKHVIHYILQKCEHLPRDMQFVRKYSAGSNLQKVDFDWHRQLRFDLRLRAS